MSTPIVAFIVEAIEHERGWGCRPDGFLVFKTEEGADTFLAKVAADREKDTTVPDEYTSYSKVGYKEVSKKIIDRLEKAWPWSYIWLTNASQLKE